MRSDSMRRKYAAFGAGIFSALILVGAVALVGGSDPGANAGGEAYLGGDAQLMPVNGEKPCVAGGLRFSKHTEVAASFKPRTFFSPDHDLANSGNLRVAWMCTAETTDILFESGIRLTQQPTEDPDLQGDWRREVARDPNHHRLTTVGSSPAKFFDNDGDALVETGGAIAWLIGRDLLVVSSETHSLAMLKAVAETVRPYAK